MEIHPYGALLLEKTTWGLGWGSVVEHMCQVLSSIPGTTKERNEQSEDVIDRIQESPDHILRTETF